MAIKHIIVHELAKEPLEKVVPNLRGEENPKNDHADRVSSQLANLFKAMNIGSFTKLDHPSLPGPPFESLLIKYFDGNDFKDFVAFSHAAAELLVSKLNEPTAQQAKGGYLLFNHYLHQTKHFISVVLLRMRQGISLAEDLSFTEVDELNLDTLHMAARINLTDWKTSGGDRYIAFKIGRQAREVTDYFSNFIGCREYTLAKADTRALVDATRDYCERRELDEPDTLAARRAVEGLCRDHLRNEKTITLEGISKLLDAHYPPENEEDHDLFLTIAQTDYSLTNTPAIDKNTLRRFVRFSGRTTKLYISFDAELLEEGGLKYDRESKSLTITELPDSLLQDLEKTPDPNS